MRGTIVRRGQRYYAVLDLPRGEDGKRKQKWLAGYVAARAGTGSRVFEEPSFRCLKPRKPRSRFASGGLNLLLLVGGLLLRKTGRQHAQTATGNEISYRIRDDLRSREPPVELIARSAVVRYTQLGSAVSQWQEEGGP